MKLNPIFELSMVLDTEKFQKIFDMAYNKTGYLKELDDEYLDTSLMEKGITVIYRDSQYKKRIRLLINLSLVVDDPSDTDKLLRKLDKRIGKYFNFKFGINDFTLSGLNLIIDIDVGSWENVAAYLKVLQRVSKIKGFSPASYDGIDENSSFCLSGNSNAIDFLLYDLQKTIVDQLWDDGAGQQKMKSVSSHTQGYPSGRSEADKAQSYPGLHRSGGYCWTDCGTDNGSTANILGHFRTDRSLWRLL